MTCYHYAVELGTRQYYRDNVTMFSGQKIDDYRYHIISIFVVATPFRHGSVLIPIVGGT